MARHLEPAGAVLQDLCHVLAHFAQRAAAGLAGAAAGGQMLDIPPGQGLRQRATATAQHFLLGCQAAGGLVLGVTGAARGGNVGQHLIEPQLELFDLARQALRRSSKPIMPQPRDLHPQPLRLQRLRLQAKLRSLTCGTLPGLLPHAATRSPPSARRDLRAACCRDAASRPNRLRGAVSRQGEIALLYCDSGFQVGVGVRKSSPSSSIASCAVVSVTAPSRAIVGQMNLPSPAAWPVAPGSGHPTKAPSAGRHACL
ncbi:MAG: hypothetical protein JWO26_1977 [Rhodospirillales bacterium]|nr:hypothetical protein [Rhodospirillales bacterium]